MQDYNVILTWEAIYDVTDLADNIEEEFDLKRADQFQADVKKRMNSLGQFSGAFPSTQILYRNYSIQKRLYSPSIIFYIVKQEKQEVHVLRVLREERDWQNILVNEQDYTYPE